MSPTETIREAFAAAARMNPRIRVIESADPGIRIYPTEAEAVRGRSADAIEVRVDTGPGLGSARKVEVSAYSFRGNAEDAAAQAQALTAASGFARFAETILEQAEDEPTEADPPRGGYRA